MPDRVVTGAVSTADPHGAYCRTASPTLSPAKKSARRRRSCEKLLPLRSYSGFQVPARPGSPVPKHGLVSSSRSASLDRTA